MKTVHPITDIAMISAVEEFLKGQCERNYFLFAFGIYSGLRISDMLKLRVFDVKNKDEIVVVEKKTGKEKVIQVNDEFKAIIRRYCSGKRDYEYLFKSRKGDNKPISRIQAYKIFQSAANAFDLKNIGCHTTRKTYGYHLWQITKDIEQVSKTLNHSCIKYTERYIGLEQENLKKAQRSISYKKVNRH